MKTMLSILFAFLAIFVPSVFAQADLASQVDPFIGTKFTAHHDSGDTIPGATLPFGMLYWSPDSAKGSFYHYDDLTTRGFSLLHLSGPGCDVYGDVPIFPMLGLPAQP